MVEKLHKSTEFKEWVGSHADFYLAHAFVMQDEQNRGIWQIGYFNDKIDKMITFIMENDKISITPEQDVMKASQKIVELVPSDVKISVDEAVAISKKVDALLLDSGNPNLKIKELGGTGETHNWHLSRKIANQSSIPVFLAGGLNPDNVKEALDQVQPFGLDVCSGVRTNGILDEQKLESFINNALA